MNVSQSSLASLAAPAGNPVSNNSTTSAPATTPTTPTPTPTPTTTTGGDTSGLGSVAGGVSKTQFLQLLVAQLTHQDPLQPQDSTAFVSQLAQFASLEQSTETNTQLAAIAAGQGSAERAGMANLVGRNITARADSLTLAPQNGPTPALQVHLDTPAANVQVLIKNSAGQTVRTVNMGPRSAGDFDTNWAGLDDKGVGLPAGTYSVQVSAQDASKHDLTGGYAEIRGVVSALEFAGGSSRFRVGSATVNPGDILNIN